MWELGSPRLPVEPLTARDATVKVHFSNPEVQFIGSTSGCGCDFPNVMFQGGDWPYYEDPEIEPEVAASDRLNCEALVSLLRSTGDSIVELYGIWDGDFAEAPKAFETIPVEAILNEGFRFKERGFYKVRMMPD
jgi:hypothetical protein